MMFFVTRNIKVSDNTYTERSVKKGGYGSIIDARRAAVRTGNCFIRDDHRKIVGQTIAEELPLFVYKV